METLSTDKDAEMVKACLAGQLSFDAFTAICTEALELVRDTGYTKMLFDSKKMMEMPEGSYKWMRDWWYDEAEKLCVLFMAFLVPDDFFGQASLQNANRRAEVERPVLIRYFLTESDAREWLLEQQLVTA